MSGTGSPPERRGWRPPPLGVLLLAALTYLPALTAKPGRMPTDTKLYLYLDPGRLIADAPFTWDTRQFAGWVPHQTIAYLWPSGPWFWTFDQLGVPDWVAHRLWIGTLLFLGGLGARWAARQLGMASTPAAVAGVVYCLSPYLLPYVSRTSVMLLPWMGLGWLVGLTVRATVRTRWRDVGLFGLVVLTIGAVNATALALVAPAPVLWLLHAAWQQSITWRTAVMTALKLGGISVVVSLWWMVMLVVQGRHGADVLAFSETLEAVSLTSTSTETLRGLGYWLFYVRDPYAFTTTAAIDHLGSTRVILAGYLLTALCLLGLALVRWSQRRFAAWLVVAGIVLAVGVHPIDQPAPLMAPLRDSALGLALRSSTRALPLSVLGLALGAASLVTLAGRVRVRGRGLGTVAAAGVVVVTLIGIPAATSGGYVDPALERDQDVPAAWDEAVAALDAGSTEHRVMQLPGSEFGAFRWGYTVDPPLPGLTDKPLVTRDLLPLGSPGAMDLLYALDNRFQAGTLEPGAIAPVARFLGVDTIWVANDLAFDRFRTPRPELVAAMFATEPDGLGSPVPHGDPAVNVPDIAMLDEQELSSGLIGTPLAPVELVPVDDPQPIVRTGTQVVVLVGSGDGIVDAAAAGLLRGDEVVVYAADLDTIVAAPVDRAVPNGALLVVTDSNRDRAAQWRGSQDVTGMTESGGAVRDVLREDSSDQRLAVFADVDADEQTVALLDGGLAVRATGYGEPFALRPEDRPAMAVDGDPATAWRVADRSDPVGERIELSTTDGTLTLLQQQLPDATRRIAEVRIDAGRAPDPTSSQVIVLDDRSLTAPGQPVEVPAGEPVSITITRIAAVPTGTDTGPSAVGFAELGPVATETVRLPVRGIDSVTSSRPVAVVMTRDRVRATNRWRHDPEPRLDRTFELPVERTFDVAVTLRRDDRAPDALLDDLAVASGVARPQATSTRRLTGVPAARGSAAVDGDPLTAWTTPFGEAVGSALTIELAAPANGPLTLVQSIDPRTSPITEIAITSGAGEWIVAVPAPDATGASTVALPAPLAPGPVTLTITAVESRTTVDRRWAETVQLPASISEIGGLEVATRPVADASPVGCRSDLLMVDGTPVGVRVDTDHLERLAAGETVESELCTPDGTTLDLDPGVHRFRTAPGATTGIHVDRLVLRSGEARVAEPVAEPTVERTRSTRTVTVAPCPTGCWLVLGEGYNPAWEAQTISDTTVTPPVAPVQVAGGFNGWWLSPSETARTVELRWTPQRGLDLALGIALLGVVACVILALVDRRVRPTALPVAPPDDGIEPATDRPRQAVAAAAVLVVAAGLAIAPVWALVALVPAAVIVATRRSSSAALAASVTVGVLGLMVAWRQYRERFLPDAAWPGRFDDLHRPGVFVVVLLLAGTWIDRTAATRPRDADGPDDRTGVDALDDVDGSGPDQDTAAVTTDPAR
ncbi:MAG: DUF3367 domain-containing protein [Actinobacteria bacterium]|uniref:Unannotated protein n=1 Tax=freshwater metagenome TaxID=449393 RepID=A0A6J6E1B5_9ZZZZ|nr:DUF3367 domain-containing protein [Actinomycetota bacterium]